MSDLMDKELLNTLAAEVDSYDYKQLTIWANNLGCSVNQFIALALLAKFVEDNDRSARRFSYRTLGVLEPIILEGAMSKLRNLSQ